MTDGTTPTYNFSVNSDGTITPGPNNGKAVTWDPVQTQFTVCDGTYAIQLSPGNGVLAITGITFSGNNEPPIVVAGPSMTDTADCLGGPWEFSIAFSKPGGDGGSIDPKIYNDGSAPPQP